MPHTLRKSLGPFSAGTRIQVLSDNSDDTCSIEVLVPEPTQSKDDSYSFEDLVFDIEKEYLVELRSRSENVTKVNRRQRRAFLSQLFSSDATD